jgi:hypothetical protein
MEITKLILKVLSIVKRKLNTNRLAALSYYYYLFILHRAESYGNGYLLSKAHNLSPVSTSSAFSHIFGLLALSRP